VTDVTILRLRTDEWYDAGAWRAILLGARPDPREDPSIKWHPPFLHFLDDHDEATPGDVWEVRRGTDGQGHLVLAHGTTHEDWPVTGYGLVCPIETCRDGVHTWTHAHNCPARESYGGRCKRGVGRLSCWDWTGSIEHHDLTASPSLQILPSKDAKGVPYPSGDTRQTCEFHGWLKAGILAPG
jgi:hypothetical protein